VVFFLHRRVEDIAATAARLAELVPEARVATAHGQMNEHQLEAVIDSFWRKETDVLVCTTIVETGLDVSNANTLIVDRADRMGLSQLHQLRGRVGRGRERAYAYFLYPSDKPLTETALERLRTIATNTDLGAGMQVAMKDLEIRGSGNLLGGEQSGHIAGVGFDLYVRMVSEGVDVPRLAVGVYATSTSTPLFFAQAVGRFVRSRARGETASVFLPSVTPLLALAGEMEVARDHVLSRPDSAAQEDALFSPEERLLAEANKTENASAELLPGFEAMDSQAEFDRVLFDGGEFGTGAMVGSIEEQEYLGLPGLLEPEQVTALLRQRQDKQIASQKKQAAAEAQRRKNSGVDDARRRAAARKELSQLVAAWARRSSQPHGVVHNELRRVCGGPEVAAASTEEIEKRIQTLRRWFVGKR